MIIMTVKRTLSQVTCGIIFGILLCLTIIPAASAFTATQTSSGTTLYSGDPISIQINGLADGDQFTYKITSTDLQTPQSYVTLSNVNMPFSFQTGTSQTSLTTTGMASGSTSLTVTSSDGSQIIMPSSGNTISSSRNIVKDTYTVFMSGTKTDGSGDIVGIDYSVSGTVSSPTNPSSLSFNLANVNTGHITVEILQGSTSRYLQTFTIIVRSSTPATGDSGDGGSGSSSGDAGTGAAGQQQGQQQQEAATATTATLQSNTQGQVLANYDIETDTSAGFTSSLGITAGTTVVSPAGQPVTEVSVAPMAASSVPSNSGAFSFSGFAVECGPTGTQFTGTPATISFSLTPSQWASALAAANGNTAAMTIQTYDAATQSWVSIPTTVNTVTHTVSAQVSHFSTYALFYSSEQKVTPAPLTIGQLANITQTPVTPAVAKTTLAPAVTTMPVKSEAPASAPVNSGFPDILGWFAQLFGQKQ